MPIRNRFRRRVIHHLAIGVLAGSVTVLVALAAGGEDFRYRASMGTAYAGLAAIGVSLTLGPLNLLRQRPNPVSSDLRRDVGIWAAFLSLLHVGIGLTVHLRGRMEQYFIAPADQRGLLPIRTDPFGAANYLGVISGLVLLLLLILSNDLALRRLGTSRWKQWQRLNYVGAGAVILHGVLYQLIERRRVEFVLLFAVLLAIPLVLQVLGIRARRSSSRAVQVGHFGKQPEPGEPVDRVFP